MSNVADPEPPVPANRRYPASEDFPSGPDIGERLPEIVLQDQDGRWVNLEEARGNRRALVLFHRSLDW
jgi:hypothetical protein